MALLTAKYMLRCWKRVSMEEQDKTVYRSNSYLTGANYDTLSLRMEQTLSEITSLDSGPHEHSHFSNHSGSEGKQMWNIHMHIWILIVELYIKLGQVSHIRTNSSSSTNHVFNTI